jgi:hypothetical protein
MSRAKVRPDLADLAGEVGTGDRQADAADRPRRREVNPGYYGMRVRRTQDCQVKVPGSFMSST